MDIALFLLTAFLASVLLVGIHTYLGIHVLSRNVIFVDLALAQISALGATVAFMLGYLPQSAASYGYSLAFTLIGALVLALSRNWVGRISQEAFVGVTYVVAAAAAFLLVDQAPQGAEHIKQLLVGSILTVTYADLLQLLIVYGAIGLFHWLLRERFLLLSLSPDQARRLPRALLWDFLFYASFGVVVTSSVAVAGVLLVFSFLIIPAAIGALYSKNIRAKLIIGWVAGTLASALGLIASYAGDLPTGAAMVCVFGLALVIAALLKPWLSAPARQRRQAYAKARSAAFFGLIAVALLSGAWLVLQPRADQPLLDLLEAQFPQVRAVFLTAAEQEIFLDAVASRANVQAQAQRMNEMERRSRWQGKELSDDELRKLSSYAQTFQEMQKGEEFVQREIRNKARERQRWIVGLPLLLTALALLLFRKNIMPLFGLNSS
jgi:zinc/manganese transport system permease protein